MYDLKTIAVFEAGLMPPISMDDLPVQLNGEPVRLHAEFLNQGANRFRRKLTLSAVNNQIHFTLLSLPGEFGSKWEIRAGEHIVDPSVTAVRRSR